MELQLLGENKRSREIPNFTNSGRSSSQKHSKFNKNQGMKSVVSFKLGMVCVHLEIIVDIAMFYQVVLILQTLLQKMDSNPRGPQV